MNKKVTSVSILVVLVVFSAFSLVGIRHLNRMYFIEMQALLDEADELEIEWERFQLGVDSYGISAGLKTLPEKN